MINKDNYIYRKEFGTFLNDDEYNYLQQNRLNLKKQKFNDKIPFDTKHSTGTLKFIENNIEEWLNKEYVLLNYFNITYDTYCLENGIGEKDKLSSMKMNKALEEYCFENDIQFIPIKNMGKIDGKQQNAKIFKRL